MLLLRSLLTGTLALLLLGNAAPPEIIATARGGAALPEQIELLLTSVADSAVTQRVVLRDGSATAAGDPGSEWSVAVATAGWWAAPQTLRIGESAAVPLWQAGTLTGAVTVGEGASLPEQITLIVEAPPEPALTPEIARGTTFTCPVDRDGRWACSVPVTPLDLKLRVPGLTPHYRWGVKAVPDEKTDLGTFPLRPGGSLTAYLSRQVAAALKSPARARLLRPHAPVATAMAARLAAPVAEAFFDRRGWVQLAPLPAGSYVLEVQGDGLAPARIAPVEIYEGKESAFRKLIELFPPLDLTLSITPPTDDQGERWSVRWARHGDLAPQAVASGTTYAGADGFAAIAGQSPGLYDLGIVDRAGNTVWRRDVRVDSAADAQLTIALELQRVTGTVSLGDDPLQGTLWFGGKDAADRIRSESGADGKFAVRLPRTGRWDVAVTGSDPAVQSLVEVDVEPAKELEIRVPDTTVTGHVIDAGGARLAQAAVTILLSGRALVAKADQEGAFRFRGLPDGRVQLTAENRADGTSSQPVSLHLQEGETRENVVLRIDPARAIAGVVVSAGTPVVGASIVAAPRGVAGNVSQTSSDLNGRFTANLTAAATRAHLTVAAPGRTLQTYEVPLSGESVELDVAPVGGTLEIEVSAEGRWSVSRNGVDVPLPAIAAWLTAQGVPMPDGDLVTVPNVAPGHYQVCGGPAGCTEGTLAPRGTLRLSARATPR